MREDRISNVEKEVAVMKATVEPLLEQIRDNTKQSAETQKAVTCLTHEISAQVKLFGDIEEKTKDHEGRLQVLEKKDAVNDSGREVWVWIYRSIITLTTGGAAALVLFAAQKYFESK